MKWINIDDQLPTITGEYIVFTEKYSDEKGIYEIVTWDIFDYIWSIREESSIKKTEERSENPVFYDPYVSHWMHRPEPPKEKL